MQTVLVLHSDPRLETFLARTSSPDCSYRDFSLQDCRSEEHLIQVLPPQVRMADAVLVDLVSMNILGKWILTWLRSHHNDLPVIVRLTPEQVVMADPQPHWTYFYQADPIDRVRQIIHNYLAHWRLQQEMRFLKDSVSRKEAVRTTAAVRVAPVDIGSSQYREAFVNLSRMLGSGHDLRTLSEQVVSLLREMFGLGKIAIFVRERDVGLSKTASFGVPQGNLIRSASIGIPREMMSNFHLTFNGGIGRYAATQAKILRSDTYGTDLTTPFEPQIQKEFGVMGTEFAVPILDRDTTLGVLTFGGKVTGEPFANEELELIFNLMNQLGMMISNIWLHHDVAGQQSFMQDVLAHIRNGVVVISGKSKIAALNRRAAELLGLKETGAIGADVSWLPSQVADVLYEVLQSGKSCEQREILLQKTDRFLSVSTSRFTASADDDRATSTAFAVAVIEDITDVKRQHAQTREVEQQEFILQLASRLSHELKNSLVSVNTFAQLLPQQYDRKEFRDEFFKIVAHEVTRVDLLVENLTFFAHPLILRYEEADLSELMDQAVNRVVEEHKKQYGPSVVTTTSGQQTILSATGQPIVLNKRYSHTAKRIECDPKRLALAIHNLLHNAIQSMPNGGRLSLVTDDAKPNGHKEPRVCISVIDTGEGIPLPNLQLIFQPFFTTRNVGVGLGLTISQKVVVKHGGHISVESKLGKGTSMIVTVPVKAAPVTEDAAPSREERPPSRTMLAVNKLLEASPRT